MKLLSVLILSLLVTSCGLEPYETEPLEEGVEALVTSLSGFADELSNERSIPKALFLKSLNENNYQTFSSIPTCPRAKASTCKRGIRSTSYSSCGNSKVSSSGSLKLQYSNQSCKILSTGDSVNKYINEVTHRGVRNNNLKLSSKTHYNYENNLIQGGITATMRPDDSYELVVLGMKKELRSPVNNQLTYYSIESTQRSILSNENNLLSFSRNGRKLTGGEFVIYNNIEQFKAIMQPADLKWRSGCCHPVSGSIQIKYEGRKTGSALAVFSNTCGQFQYAENGSEPSTLEIEYCE